MRQQPRRYFHMIEEIARRGAVNLVEIGTYRGERAEQMIRAAQKTAKSPDSVCYWGFDLFERPPDYELTVRTVPPPMRVVEQRLRATGARIELVRGNSRDTLPAVLPSIPIPDFVFIDGGHSEETVAADFLMVHSRMRRKTVVYLDDFWNYGEGGCNALVERLRSGSGWRVEVLDPADEWKRDWGTLRIQAVRVQLR